MAQIQVTSLTKRYQDFLALDGINLNADHGELVSLLGPSGCGKSTTLRLIAGFLEPSGGDITVDGQSIVNLPTNKRDFGVVFQNYALFPHMTVSQNVGYGLIFRQIPSQEAKRKIAGALDLVQLGPYADRFPRQLSGGQQQRVALARALVFNPRLLLLDEPLANLDARLRDDVRWLIRDLQQESRTTAFYVTHDQAEAMAISDRVAVMKSGRVAQFATPREIYQRPVGRYVANFTGEANFLSLKGCQELSPGIYRVPVDVGEIAVPGGPELDQDVELLLRPESLSIAQPGSPVHLNATLRKTAFLGANLHCEGELANGDLLRFWAPANEQLNLGSRVALEIDLEHAWLMKREAP
jgi:iron(III) transport system ATP-binding protein